jgi:carboxyl-terminal processing protease
MTRKSWAGTLLIAFCLQLLAPLRAADLPAVSGISTATNSPANSSAAAWTIRPGPDAGRIAFFTARMLEQLQYLHHPFDEAISSKLLDGYLNSLDPQHILFLQSDIDGFDHYRTNLDQLTITRSQIADTRPAYEIFSRFMQRLQQRQDYTDDLLKNEKFEFNTDEQMVVNRHDLPYPQDLDEAKALWRQRLRFEYLQEKLGWSDSPKTNAASTNAVAGKTDPPKTMHETIVETLAKRYHNNLHILQEWDSTDVLDVYLNALAHAYDPHTDYQAPVQYDDFAISMNRVLFGIGAGLQSEDGYCKIRELLPGPALESKRIKVGDRIVAVAQSNQPPVDIVDMPLNKAVRLIRGPKGTEVRLTIIPVGAPNPTVREIVTLIRDEIKLEDADAKSKIIETPDGKGGHVRLGIIDLPSFYATIDNRGHPDTRSTTADVARLLKKFKEEKVDGVILDLRRNGGGSLEEAIRLTGLFIKDGPVVQIRNPNNKVEVEENSDSSMCYSGPLIVLTSRFSASASEIVAAALQDYGRALIVGDISTFGKGTAQRLYPLRPVIDPDIVTNDPGTLKVTSSKFYRASGASTELKGVIPDIVLPSVWNNSTDVGECVLDNHMPWDTIDSVRYDKLNLVQPYLPELLRRSSDRVATNQDFAYVREDIDLFRKQQADKTISLNENQRRKEKEEADAREKARDKERLSRTKPDEKIYEITLKQADSPGLPPPAQKTNSTAAANEPGGAGTNATLAALSPAGAPVVADIPGEIKPPAVDADMDEARRIMMDYISLLPQGSPLLVAH